MLSRIREDYRHKTGIVPVVPVTDFGLISGQFLDLRSPFVDSHSTKSPLIVSKVYIFKTDTLAFARSRESSPVSRPPV